MTNDDSVLREVDRAMAEDRQSELFQKNAPVVIAGAAAIVLAVGGWQFWKAREAAQAAEAAAEFATASEIIAESPADGRLAFEAISESGPAGYATLARLRIAASLAVEGDRQGALAHLRQAYNDTRAPKRLRDLARVRAAALSLEDGRQAALDDLGGLMEGDSVFRHYAQEIAGLAALDARDYPTAQGIFERASADPETPSSVRQRAAEFAALAAAGAAGVNITGSARVDDLLEALDMGLGAGHEGHDHGGEDHDHAAEDAPAPTEAPAEAADETVEEAPEGDDAEQDQ